MNTNSKANRFQRGHESDEHRSLKPAVISVLEQLGFEIALCEHRYCDVVAVKLADKSSFVLAVEIERSVRNLLRNLDRDFTKGRADAVLVVSPNFETMAAIARKLARTLTEPQRARVGLANLAALRILQQECVTDTSSTRKE